jgi:hypothetical protein
MTDNQRGKLTVRPVREGLIDEAEDRPLQLATIDLTLPCRQFAVDHKIADVGKVSVTAEFLLRFIRSMGSCTEDAAQAFFGYTRREMAYVLHEVENADYIKRSDGRISLTATGQGLFCPGVEEPLIYEVERKSARVAFDLLSLAPAERRFLSYFDQNLPELPLADPKQVSTATERVPNSFRRFFREFAPKVDPNATARRSLYSIDAVSAEERFSTVVRVQLVSTGLKPSVAEIDLSEWKSDYELSDREAVSRAVAQLVDTLSINRRADDDEAYDLLLRLAPEYLKEWKRRDGLSVQRYYRNAFTNLGDVRVDRQTTPIVGSLFTLENARRLVEVANYGFRRARRGASALYWVVPQAPLWGSSGILPEAVERFRDRIVRTNEDLTARRPVDTVSLSAGRPDRWVREAFENCCVADRKVFPGGFELLLVPGAFMAATVHAPIGQASGMAVPLGFASFDEKIVSRAMKLLEENAAAFKLPERLVYDLGVTEPPATAEPDGADAN